MIQVLCAQNQLCREPILAAVGELQFDVVTARLTTEYGVETALDRLLYAAARWILGDHPARSILLPSQSLAARDQHGQTVILFSSEWEMKYCFEKNPGVTFGLIHEVQASQANP